MGSEVVMFGSGLFDYVNVLHTSMDAASLRNDIISNNIANVNTPDYKRKDLRFETELKHAFVHSGKKTVDARVKDLDLEALEPEVYTDYEELSFRYDGNNVDINNEEAILAKNQIKYNGMQTLLNKEFANMQKVLK